jgi:hypothetical protein
MPAPCRRGPWSLWSCQHELRQRLQRSSGAAHGPQTRHKAEPCIVGARIHPNAASRRPAPAPWALTARAAFCRCLGSAEVPRRGARTSGALWGILNTPDTYTLHFSFKQRAAPPVPRARAAVAHAAQSRARSDGDRPRRDPAAPSVSVVRPNRARGPMLVYLIV